MDSIMFDLWTAEDFFGYSARIIILFFLAYIANFVTKRYLLRFIEKLTKKTKTKWDDILFKRKVFTSLSHLAPVMVIYGGAIPVLRSFQIAIDITQKFAMIYMIIVGTLTIFSFLNAVIEIYRTLDISKDLPIKSFIQVVKIIIFFITCIVIISILLNKPAVGLLTGLGAFTAVLMLIFKDSILGLVAGIQLSVNEMLRIGDWIEMPSQGADGDVIDISLTTVKVRNFDKTITTIPTYALISDSFKNWRGMKDSGGRRIKRNIYIDQNSIDFCTIEMIDRFKQFNFLSDYIKRKEEELKDYNQEHEIDEKHLVNGRRMTNIGVLRAYIVEYLKHHPKIRKDFTFLIRQLAPCDTGLPIQIYVFTNDTVWGNYEAIQADIFDHILAIVPRFGLQLYQAQTDRSGIESLNLPKVDI